MLNEESTNSLDVETKSDSMKLLKSKQRNLKDIRNDFYSLIDKDDELSKIFGTTSSIKGNNLMESLREELLNDLLQLVETVLLEKGKKREFGIKKELLEKRL